MTSESPAPGQLRKLMLSAAKVTLRAQGDNLALDRVRVVSFDRIAA